MRKLSHGRKSVWQSQLTQLREVSDSDQYKDSDILTIFNNNKDEEPYRTLYVVVSRCFP